MHAEQVDSDAALVRRLLAEQFPQWADRTIERLPSSGTDNSIYRLGADLVVRLPLIHWAVGQVEKEHTWLPRLAPLLPLTIPEPLAMGEPGAGYPWRWSVYRWIDGLNAHPDRVADLGTAAIDLAGFVKALHAVDFPDAPRSQRGVELVTKDAEIRGAITAMRHEFDADALTAAWDEAISAPPWAGPSVLVHGDLSDGNLLVRDGRLHAVIDFSCFGWGEPANDLDVAWDLFSGASRDAYRAAIGADDDTWTRGRGWAITAVFGIPYYEQTNPGIVVRARRRIAAVLADYSRSHGEDPRRA
jgi:aminoglycoside phosphotransferase (APT) family kinase protein